MGIFLIALGVAGSITAGIRLLWLYRQVNKNVTRAIEANKAVVTTVTSTELAVPEKAFPLRIFVHMIASAGAETISLLLIAYGFFH